MGEAESAVENRKAAVRSEAVREGPLVSVTGVILPKLGANRYGLMGDGDTKRRSPNSVSLQSGLGDDPTKATAKPNAEDPKFAQRPLKGADGFEEVLESGGEGGFDPQGFAILRVFEDEVGGVEEVAVEGEG